jgi:hypothetical protein
MNTKEMDDDERQLRRVSRILFFYGVVSLVGLNLGGLLYLYGRSKILDGSEKWLRGLKLLFLFMALLCLLFASAQTITGEIGSIRFYGNRTSSPSWLVIGGTLLIGAVHGWFFLELDSGKALRAVREIKRKREGATDS